MKKLLFENKYFDAAVCLYTTLPEKPFFEKLLNIKRIPIIAADGAATYLLKQELPPDYIIGDMDSFHEEKLLEKFQNIKLIKIADQETNDFEKILLFALNNNLNNLLILGMHGGILEHSLNNWSVFMKYSNQLNMCIYEDKRYGVSLSRSISFNSEINEIISLIPQPKVKLTTRNLKWNLNNEILELGVREGARNIATADEIQIEIHSGGLLFFCNSRLPFAPNFTDM